jgi:outer membrane protein, heavy metal efflux system
MRDRSELGLVLAVIASCLFCGRPARAQIQPSASPPGSEIPAMGTSPGSHAQSPTLAPSADNSPLAPGTGPGFPRVPRGLSRPGGQPTTSAGPALAPVEELPALTMPVLGPLRIPDGTEDQGPADGLTLEVAIELLVRDNLDLRSKAVEIPMAEADVLTASLRANPVLFTDAQMVPYGNFTAARPGGQTQYDLNVSFPVDLTGKRRARTVVARKARCVLEAQYLDAVRLQIENLHNAFVDVLALRETIRFAEAGVDGLRHVREKTLARLEQQTVTPSDVGRVEIQLETAELALLEAQQALVDAKIVLAGLLNLPIDQAEAIEVRGSLRVEAAVVPSETDLIVMAFANRPDLAAFRLGLERAQADVDLAMANRFENPFVLVQPYTFQNNAPFGEKSAHSWAVGVTVPLPVFNRNQGNIQRSRLNVAQTQTQLADIERLVAQDVRRAVRAYAVTSNSVQRIEASTLPRASKAFDASRMIYDSGQSDLIGFSVAVRDYNDVVKAYRDALVRNRRAMLRINTVVGQRVMP